MGLGTAVGQAYESVFESAVKDPHRLVALHRRVQKGRGRRSEQLTSLNRAVIVASIAAWQAYVEALATAIISSLGLAVDPTSHGTALRVVWEGRRSEVEQMIQRFSTADSNNTLRLLHAVNFYPENSWSWGRGASRQKPGQVKQRLDGWVKIRHSIAHGSPLPSKQKWLLTENDSGLTIRLKDAESCLGFVERLAAATDTEARSLAERIDGADRRASMAETRRELGLARLSTLLG